MKKWCAVGAVDTEACVRAAACVKAGRACFYCLPVRDGHCLNPLSSSNVATVLSVSITSLKAHSTID